MGARLHGKMQGDLAGQNRQGILKPQPSFLPPSAFGNASHLSWFHLVHPVVHGGDRSTALIKEIATT